MTATITINSIPAQTENATVTIGGTLTVTPTPAFKLDSGTPVAATAVTVSEAWTGNLTVPSTAGTHTIAVKDAATGATATASLTVNAAAPPPPPPPAAAIYIAPGVGSFVDTAGNVYTLTSGGIALKDAKAIPGGSGTAQVAFYNGAVYGQDAASKSWYIWNGTSWNAAAAPPAPTVGLSPSGTTLTNATGSIVMSSDGFAPSFSAQFGPNSTVVVTLTKAFGQVEFGGKIDTTTTNVSLVLYYNGVLYQENTAGKWWSGTAGNWKSVARDPRT